MSYNGSGTFVLNQGGYPYVPGTVIASANVNTLLQDLAGQGYVRARIDGEVADIADFLGRGEKLARYEQHTIEVVVDRLVLRDGIHLFDPCHHLHRERQSGDPRRPGGAVSSRRNCSTSGRWMNCQSASLGGCSARNVLIAGTFSSSRSRRSGANAPLLVRWSSFGGSTSASARR